MHACASGAAKPLAGHLESYATYMRAYVRYVRIDIYVYCISAAFVIDTYVNHSI